MNKKNKCCPDCGTILCDTQSPKTLSWFKEFEKDEAANAKRKAH